jgi:hypothetical protein
MMAFSTIVAAISFALLGFPGLFGYFGEIDTTLFLFFCVLQVAMCDLLTEAKYAEKLKADPENGPDLMSFVWGGIFVFQLLSFGTVGVMLEWSVHAIYACCLPVVVIILYPLYNNWLGEPAPANPPFVKFIGNKLSENSRLFSLALYMGAVSLILAALSLFQDSLPELVIPIYILVAGVSVVFAFSVSVDPRIAKVQAFFLIQNTCTVSIESASFYFFTDGPEEYPDGPHFSDTFYTTVLGIVGSVFSLLGIVIYNRTMKNWKYRSVFLINNLLFMVINLINIMVYTRWNVKVGIPDEMFILGCDAFQSIVTMWTWIPGVVLTSQLCPSGLEATMYALLAGSNNLGGSLASYLGAYLLQKLGITPAGLPDESDKFDNLWIAALISATAPVIPLLFMNLLIPDARQTDKILDTSAEGIEMSASGSEPAENHLLASRFDGTSEEDESYGFPSDDARLPR